MEIIILFLGVFIPLLSIALFALFKEKQEEHKEKTA